MAPDSSDRKTNDPDVIAAQTFTTVRKGYEPDEVRAFLLSVASSLREAKLRYEDMERRLAEVERRAADPKDLDEHAVTQLLGEETARVLETARQAAADIRSRAERTAAEQEEAIAERDRLIRESADEYASGVRSSADEADRRIRADAERYAEEVRSAADAETTAQRAAADEYDERVRSGIDAEVAELRATASAEVERLRAEAASVLTERTAEAEVAASAILSEADGYSTRVRTDADRYSEATRAAADSYRNDTHGSADSYKADAVAEGDRLRQEAVDEGRRIREDAESAAVASAEASSTAAQNALDAAREQGRQMVEEARSYRERVIADLADRRRAARGQLDSIAATRDALAVSLSDVAASLSSSQRLLNELDIDPALLGDVSADRAVLEAHDAARPPLTPPADDVVPDADVDADSDVDGPDVAVDSDVAAELGVAAEPADLEETVADQVVDDVDEAVDLTVDVDEPVEEVVEAEAAAESVVAEPAEPSEASEPAEVSAEAAEVEPDGGEAGSDEPVIDLTAEQSAEPEAEAEPTPTVEEAMAEADITNGEGDGEPRDQDDVGPDGDPREGRIDQLFAKIRADRHDEPESGDATAAVASVGTDVLVEDGAAEDEAAEDDAAEEVADSDPDTDLLDRRDTALEEVEKQLARRLKRVLADEQNETLDLLRRTKGTPTAEGVLPAETDHQERYRGAALDDLSAAERTGAGFFGDAPSREADVADVADEFAGEILRQIRGQLVRALDDGGDEYELGDRIRSCYREWKTQRIAETARHYVMVAFSRGVAEAAGEDTSFRWLMDDGGQPCPDCDDNQLGGAVRKGESFPTGDLHPPAHPGCRCLAVPVG